MAEAFLTSLVPSHSLVENWNHYSFMRIINIDYIQMITVINMHEVIQYSHEAMTKDQ